VAAAYQAADQVELAIPLLKLNLAERQRRLGADHVDTAASQKRLDQATAAITAA
jgi:hypothetical protein